jgi:hypothetical protein
MCGFLGIKKCGRMMEMDNFGNSTLGIVIAALLFWAAVIPVKLGEWIAEVEQARVVLDEQENNQ